MIETKNLPKLTCIYKIVNTLNPTKFYIGSAYNLKERIQQHIRKLNNKEHHSYLLQRAVNKHGIDVFNIHIIEYCTKENIKVKEQFYLDNLDCFYNVSKNADRPEFSHIDRKQLSEKIGKSLRGKGATKNKSTGISNVYYINKEQKYVANVQRNKKKYELGKFNTLEEAVELANKYRYSELNEIEDYIKVKKEQYLSNKSSKYKGIQRKHSNLWRVIINRKHICYCKTELEAVRFYNNYITINFLNKPINIIKEY